MFTHGQDDALTVSQMDRSFAPGALSISAGQTVKVINDDRFVHHVQSKHRNLKVDSGIQRPGEYIEIAFAKQGIYELTCAIHPKMSLKVAVD